MKTDRDRVEFLFQLLDDVDTLDDACKGDDAAFRKAVRTVQKRRWETGITTDGNTLTHPDGATGTISAVTGKRPGKTSTTHYSPASGLPVEPVRPSASLPAERGQETIVPLRSDSSGQLGTEATGGAPANESEDGDDGGE